MQTIDALTLAEAQALDASDESTRSLHGPYPSEEQVELAEERDIYCEFRTGQAGTGKTHYWREKIQENPHAGLLMATTGIAAVNLNTATINSLLGYYDTESLYDRFVTRRLHRAIARIYEKREKIVLDEVSMMDARQLDLIHLAAQDVAQAISREQRGIVLVGDFCQLPPVKADWAFTAECWHRYEANTVRMTQNWRQADERFLEALGAARGGDGETCAELLRGICQWSSVNDVNYPGTTIVAKNDAVDGYNRVRLMQDKGREFSLSSTRWGQQSGEWKLIPDRLRLKEGALVMILANDPPAFSYVNGDLGTVCETETDVDEAGQARVIYTPTDDGKSLMIRLARNGQEIYLPMIERLKTQPDRPREDTGKTLEYNPEAGARRPQRIHYDVKESRWVVGGIWYYPLRLGYASTVHKTQGLTLDKVQVDIRDGFFGSAAMVYVALSRARTPENLRIVGTPEILAKRVKVDPKVVRWL